ARRPRPPRGGSTRSEARPRSVPTRWLSLPRSPHTRRTATVLRSQFRRKMDCVIISPVPDPMTFAGLVVGAAVGGGLALHFVRGAKLRRRHAEIDAKSTRLGHTEPVSLHPRIDEHKCICTGACVQVCPEKDVLGMIDGKPKLIRPSACIGHGECLRA